MQSDDNKKALALDRVMAYCKATIQLENRPSDDEYDMAERLLKMIYEELERK
jgi:hypothetical protein